MAPGSRTSAATTDSPLSSGIPTTATSRTPGIPMIASSTCDG